MLDSGKLGIIKVTSREEWDTFALDNGAHPLQLWGWGQLKASHGWVADRYFLVENNRAGEAENGLQAIVEPTKVLAAAQVLTRKLPYPFRAYSYIPRGPFGNLENHVFTDKLLGLIAADVHHDYRSVALAAEPDCQHFSWPHSWRPSPRPILSAETIQLDLSKSEDELQSDMAKKTRQYIRKSGGENLEIRTVRSQAELDAVLKIYQGTAHRAHFRLHGEQYYRDVFTQMGENNVIFVSLLGEKPVAFLWVALSATSVYELYGGMTNEGAELRANYALKWHAIQKMKEWGLETYDFGGMIEGGVSNFKQGWAKEPTTLVQIHEKPLSPLYNIWIHGLPAAKKIVRLLKRR